jgi:hypothetical protein
MSIQARLSKEDPRLYNPNRDVAHNFRQVIERVAGRLEDKLWPDLTAILKREKVSMNDLGDACAALCKFIVPDSDEMKLSMQECLDRSGWFRTPGGAQVAVMAILGTVLLGYHFAGVREATIQGEGPVLSLQGLAERGEEAARYVALSPWRRTIDRVSRRFCKAVRILMGRTD